MIEVKSVRLDTRTLDAIGRRINNNAEGVLRSIAFQVEAEAKVRAPYLTGALKSSIRTLKFRDLTYHVTDAVEYGIYQEMGTKKMRGQPFLVPAVDKVSELIDEMFGGVFDE